MKSLSFILITIFSIMALGCQSDPSTQDQSVKNILSGQFYVRYLQTEKELKAEVTFNTPIENGQTEPIELTSVSFEGEPMKIRRLSKPVQIIRYDHLQRGLYQSNYRFEFKHDKLGLLTNTLSMNPILKFSVPNNRVKKSEGLIINWEGFPLTSEQRLVLFFTDENKQAFTAEVEGPTESSTIKLSSDKVTGLKPGQNQLALIQKQLRTKVQNGFQSLSEIEFYTDPITIVVEE
jgi:hypothetical protein